MKRWQLFATLVTAILLLATFLSHNHSKSHLPRANNTTPYEELITTQYPDDFLLQFENRYHNGHNDHVLDLSEHFKIECVRHPEVYGAVSRNYSYILILSDSGKKLFAFFDPSSHNPIIEDLLIVDHFISVFEMKNLVNQMVTDRATKIEWNVLGNMDIGTSTRSSVREYAIPVNEGTYCVAIDNFDIPELQYVSFYSDTQLLTQKEHEETNLLYLYFTPILPLDKGT